MPSFDESTFATVAIRVGVIAVALLLINLVTYCICRSRSKYYSTCGSLAISIFFNIEWVIPVLLITFLAVGEDLTINIYFACIISIIVSCLIHLFNLCVFKRKIAIYWSEWKMSRSPLSKIRGKIVEKYNSEDIYNYNHAKTDIDVNSYLQNNPPVIRLKGLKITRYGSAYSTW